MTLMIESVHMTEFYRTPRTKKKRIRNKWFANPRNHRPSTKLLLMDSGQIMCCHPVVARQLRAIGWTQP